MKRRIIIIFIISVIANITIAYSQNTDNDWKLLNPQPSALTAKAVCFLNDQIGYILNEKQILSTVDCGKNWVVQKEIIFGTDMAFKDNYGYIIGNNNVYKSNYMGTEWNLLNTDFTDDLTGITLISKDTVFITGKKKFYTSYDAGNTWNTIDLTIDAITCSFFINSSVGFIGCYRGSVFKTTDRGKTWILKRYVDYSPSEVHQIYFIDSDTGYLSMGLGTTLKTTDGGETWVELSNLSDKINKFYFTNKQNGFIVGSYGVILKTNDGGNSWEWYGFQDRRYSSKDIFAICFINNSTGFAVGMQGRIIKTTNGGKTWNEYATSYNPVSQLKFLTSSIAYAFIGDAYIKTINGGENWEKIDVYENEYNTSHFSFIDKNIGYCITKPNAAITNINKTINGGNTWSMINNGFGIVNLFYFINEGTGFINGDYTNGEYNRSEGTFKTTNGGINWKKINEYKFGQMQFINSNIGYARNIDSSITTIYKTTDGGETWTSVFEIDKNIKSMHFLNENVGFFIAYGELIYKTIDGGRTWQEAKVPNARYVSVKFLNQNTGFITDDYGNTYQTNNGCESWLPIKKPYFTTGLEVFGNTLYAYGEDGVILKKNIGVVNALPRIINKQQQNLTITAYPNPFTDILCIKGMERGILTVFNESGAVVHTQEIISMEETLQLGHLPIGVYFLHFNNNKQVQMVKVIKKQ